MDMRVVRVGLGERSYEIRIGRGLLEAWPLAVAARAWLIVSDATVDPLYGDRVEAALRAAGGRTARVTVPSGESSKSHEQLVRIYDAALEAGLDRGACLAALGGGVVGDLAGYAAATFLRGVRYVQIPTTLLAMVDSSVGGKTAVNLPRGKNLVGAFHQPVGVVADLATLDTLPGREYRSGLAEVVKTGIIRDAALLDRIEREAGALAEREPAALAAAVARCCEIKAEVVGADEREGGLRGILNFGHTLCHALETVDGYGRWLHGEAVAVGMVYAALLSVGRAAYGDGEAGRLVRLLRAFGLPVDDGAAGGGGAAARRERWQRLRRAMSADKKSVDRAPRFVLADGPGRVSFGCEVAEKRLEAVYIELPERVRAFA